MQEIPASGAHAEPAARTVEFDFDLPPDLIAQTPAERRDGARLLAVDRASGRLAHAAVTDLPGLLRRGDLVIFNDVRVRPARLHARLPTGGTVELLLIRERSAGVWECLGRPGRRLRPGTLLRLPDGGEASVVGGLPAGRYAIDFGAARDVPALLAGYGEVPLPPYIRRPDGPLPIDQDRYQTVFARRDGAIAAPTAGLHFTAHLLEALASAGVDRAWVTLVVGPATFLPLRGGEAAGGLEGEWAEIPAGTVEAIARTRAAGGRVVAVGTTTTRALESAAARPGGLAAGGFWADAFIRPGYRFQVVDALMTNFHLPRSTLLMLVGAFAGRALTLAAYEAAVRDRYRFYSYGDAMLIT